MVVLEILSPMPLTRREDGEIIFELWKTYLPELLPDFYGNWEPIDLEFNALDIDAVLNRWKWPFLSIKIRPIVDASIWMRKGAKQRLHATLIFIYLTRFAREQRPILGNIIFLIRKARQVNMPLQAFRSLMQGHKGAVLDIELVLVLA